MFLKLKYRFMINKKINKKTALKIKAVFLLKTNFNDDNLQN